MCCPSTRSTSRTPTTSNDALDFQQVSPEFGSRDDFRKLAKQAHTLGLKVVLDGVFNHRGRNAPIFQQALADPASPYRDWFAIGPQCAGGSRSWTGFQNLPELNLEHPPVRQSLWQSPDSVLRSWLRDGADGWRLDTSFERRDLGGYDRFKRVR